MQGIPEKHPYSAYTAIMAIYLSLYAVFLALGHRSKRLQDDPLSLKDITTLGVATYALSRIVTRDQVTSFLRLPFIRHRPEDKVIGTGQQPRGRGLIRAMGELITCSRCSGTWIAALLTYALYLEPTFVRPFIILMTAVGLGDLTNSVQSMIDAIRVQAKAERREDTA
jgi:hypothetical protein